MKKITVAGIGMGGPGTLTLDAQRAVQNADVLAGAARMLEGFSSLGKPCFASHDFKAIARYIRETPYESIAVLMSGDTGFYSGTSSLLPLLEGLEVQVLPGISSLQYFCARLQKSWEDVRAVSLHGRTADLGRIAAENKRVFALTGGNIPALCAELIQAGMGEIFMAVGENLSYPDEKITRGCPKDFAEGSFAKLAVLYIENEQAEKPIPIGLPDESFIRGEVPMTKSEVRAVSLSKLALRETDVCWDIGAGTGSVSVEVALSCPAGRVFAVERDLRALPLLEANRKKFRLHNLEIISGEAPDSLKELPVPDAVFIGGTGGRLPEILRHVLGQNPCVRGVLNAVTLETLGEILPAFEQLEISDYEFCHVQVSKGRRLGEYNLMTAQNPVYIISFRGNGR